MKNLLEYSSWLTTGLKLIRIQCRICMDFLMLMCCYKDRHFPCIGTPREKAIRHVYLYDLKIGRPALVHDCWLKASVYVYLLWTRRRKGIHSCIYIDRLPEFRCPYCFLPLVSYVRGNWLISDCLMCILLIIAYVSDFTI